MYYSLEQQHSTRREPHYVLKWNVKEEYKGKQRISFLAFPLDNIWYLATKYQSKRLDKPETF